MSVGVRRVSPRHSLFPPAFVSVPFVPRKAPATEVSVGPSTTTERNPSRLAAPIYRRTPRLVPLSLFNVSLALVVIPLMFTLHFQNCLAIFRGSH
jgi:hypothetical protein